MSRTILAAIAAFALTTTALTVTARAADVVEQPPAPPAAPIITAPAFTWSGFYIGGNVGYGWADAGPNDDNGVIGGGHVGYNYEWNPIVLGIEGDMDASGMKFDGRSVDYTITGRARLGYAFDRWMIYGTGGVAYAKAGPFDDTGWVAGAGIEWAATNHIVPGIEYLHYGFGNFDHTGIDANADVIRARISFKF
jgi:outer membrane immunogenic protein